ncbi:MAG: PAS domain S-box protein, partial [Candidatus Aminicenantes bacterium]|nr:PAS domain S-box protein [Candidatus Aminicenantes bacterium]
MGKSNKNNRKNQLEQKRPVEYANDSSSSHKLLLFSNEALNKAPETILWFDSSGRIIYVNEKGCSSLSYSSEELLQMNIFNIDKKIDKSQWDFFLDRLKKEKVVTLETVFSTKNGSTIPAEMTVNHISYRGEEFHCAFVHDLSEKKYIQKIQNCIYRISEASLTAESLDDLFAQIHEIIMELMPARNNFYIALYDQENEMLSFPYFVDEYEEPPEPQTLGMGLTEYVLRTGKPILVTPEVFAELEKKNEVISIGPPSIDWLGVPLNTRDGTIGVLVIQSYTTGMRYSEEEKNILVFISEQVAMAISRFRIRDDLLESEEKYKDLIEKANLAILIADEEGRLIYVNNTFYEMFGYKAEDRKRKNMINIDVVHPDDRARVKKINQDRIKGKDVPSRYEFKGIKKDGTKIDCEIDVILLKKDGTNIGTRGYIRDITEEKKNKDRLESSLKEKEILLREIHHRVKNNLQIISSLLNLQSSFVQDEAALKMFQESNLRVRSMAIVHEKLYRSEDLSRVNFNEYITSLIGYMYQTYGIDPSQIKINVSVTDIFLDINSAIPCGLIVSELISNALKHAFPNGRKGDIQIVFDRIKPGKYRLIIEDNGVGLDSRIDIHNTESFGLQLVNMLTEQLQGKFT